MGLLQMKVGKITATAAEASGGKDVDTGFIPEFVMAWNEDAIDGEQAVLIRFGGQEAAAALAMNKFTNGTGTDNTLVDETTNGITDVDSSSIGTTNTVLTGTINPAASKTVTGVGTLFTTELAVGDQILVTNEIRRVTAIASNTSLTVDIAFTDGANDTTPEKIAAGAEVTDTGFKGFNLPSNFISAADDVIHFMALGTQFVA